LIGGVLRIQQIFAVRGRSKNVTIFGFSAEESLYSSFFLINTSCKKAFFSHKSYQNLVRKPKIANGSG